MLFRVFTFCILALTGAIIFAQTPRSAQIKSNARDLSPIRKKPTRAQREKLEPSTADLNSRSRFLAQPNTGIFRLLPDANCEQGAYVIDASRECLSQIPESSYYSFREREHTAEYLSDIRLKNDILISDGILSQSILVNLGDIPLEQVSLASDGLGFINDYQPQSLASDALKQFNEMKRGVMRRRVYLPQNADCRRKYDLRSARYRLSRQFI